MKKTNELRYTDLKKSYNAEKLKFETTAELEPITTGIGQDRGIKALEFGVHVDVKGYNLYLEGPSGVGKTMYTKNYLDKIAIKKKKPQDWCYIYNFQNPNEPIAVSLPAGQGKEFQETMETFIRDIKLDINRTFSNEDFEKEKQLIRQEFEQRRTFLLDKLNEEAAKYGFKIQTTQTGIYMLPVINGKTIEEEEFDQLDDNIKREFEEKSALVQEQIMSVISEIKAVEKLLEMDIEDKKSIIFQKEKKLYTNLLSDMMQTWNEMGVLLIEISDKASYWLKLGFDMDLVREIRGKKSNNEILTENEELIYAMWNMKMEIYERMKWIIYIIKINGLGDVTEIQGKMDKIQEKYVYM